ncbi:MAG: MlaD family protein [bacterium]
MSDETPAPVPEARVLEKRRLSVVWVIPLVAALIGAWLTWKSVSEKGPAFTITFPTADGIEAGKTKIRYRELEVGVVETLALSDDLTHVVAKARLAPGLDRYLTEKTRFWVVRARVSAGQVSGLGTLLSGAYIGIDPVPEGKAQRVFEGLQTAPLVTSQQEGTRFTLRAPSMGSLDVGVPVHYRQVQVGEVVRTQLEPDGSSVTIDVFVHAPHDQRIRTTTRWWNASGFDATVNQDGLRIETQSFLSMLIGGIAFDTPSDEPGLPVTAETEFKLASTRASAERREYTVTRKYLVRFDGSAKGLSKGSPVEFLGTRIGSVVEARLVYDAATQTFETPVVLQLEPERAEGRGQLPEAVLDRLEALVGGACGSGSRPATC